MGCLKKTSAPLPHILGEEWVSSSWHTVRGSESRTRFVFVAAEGSTPPAVATPQLVARRTCHLSNWTPHYNTASCRDPGFMFMCTRGRSIEHQSLRNASYPRWRVLPPRCHPEGTLWELLHIINASTADFPINLLGFIHPRARHCQLYPYEQLDLQCYRRSRLATVRNAGNSTRLD